MLVQCPKCGFSQPQDQYCAQCGVNMMTYRPPQKSFVSRVLGNIYVQLGSLAFVAGFALLFLWHRHNQFDGALHAAKSLSSERIKASAFLGEQKPENKNIQAVVSSPPPPTVAATASITQPAAAPAAVPAGQNLGAGASSATASAATKPGAPAPLTNPKQVKITYAEITPRGYDILTEESRSSGQFNSFSDYAAGVVPGIAKKLTQIPRDFKVITTETIQVGSGRPLQAVYDYKDRNRGPASTDFQLATNVHLESDGNSLRADVEVLKSGTKGEPANYPASFDVMSDTGYFLSGFHHAQNPQDAAGTVDSELVVLVEFVR